MAEQRTLEAKRADFEAWALDHLGQGYPLTMDEHTYEHPVTRWAFRAWQAARAAPPALDAEGLPELPKPVRMSADQAYLGYTAEQVRQAMRDAVAADRQARAAEIADLREQLALEQEHLRQAVENIAKMRAQLARQSAPEGAPAGQSTPLADLWIHEDMERDAMEAALSAPRKDLKAAHKQAVEDAIYWKRRALTAEAAAPTSASAQPAEGAEGKA